jgi:hypothetical protein
MGRAGWHRLAMRIGALSHPSAAAAVNFHFHTMFAARGSPATAIGALESTFSGRSRLWSPCGRRSQVVALTHRWGGHKYSGIR